MTLKERLAQSQAKMDEMKARVAKASEKAKNARHAIAYALEAEANIFLPPEKRLNISRNTVNNESTNGNE